MFSTEFSGTGLFWGMRNIPDLKMYLVKAAVGVTKKLNLLIPWVPVWSSSGCRARAVCVCALNLLKAQRRAAVCCQQMFHFRDGAKWPWLDPASCHLPASPLLVGRPCGWSSCGCSAGGAVCSGRNVHAHVGRGCQVSLGHLCTPRVSWQFPRPGDPLAHSCSG